MPTSNNFMENYKICCTDSKTRVKVKSLSQDKCLQFNADRLDNEDWIPLTKALKIDRTLHTLIIKSEYPGKKWRSSLIDNIKPPIHKPNVMQELIESIKLCMKESNILSTIQLQSLPISKTNIDTLSSGIKECKSLQHLAITRCQLNDVGVKSLYDSIRTHTGLQTINLTGCNITKEGARTLADIIRSQRLVRYSETWKQSLRYREPNPELLPGIRRITLNDNPEITDEGFSLIKHELMDDLWMKAIDMQNCGLSNDSGDSSIDLLKTNTTIMVLDIRRNNAVNTEKIKTIKTILQNRCNSISEKQCDHELDNNLIYDWLDGTNSTTNRSEICSSRKPNSEFSFKTLKNNNIIRNLHLLQKTNSLSNDFLQQRKFNNEMYNSSTEENVKLELKEKEKEQLVEKLVKEWNRRKSIEKERDKLKEELRNYVIETHNNSTSANRLKLSKSLNLNRNMGAAKSTPAISSPSSTISRKSKKRNKKGNKSNKKNQRNNYDVMDKPREDEKINNCDKQALSKSDSELKRLEAKYHIKQNQNELQNIQENLDKITMKRLKFDKMKTAALVLDENNNNNNNNTNNDDDDDESNLQNTTIKKDFRDLSPTSRSQWILKELMNGNKTRTKNITLNINKKNETCKVENDNDDKTKCNFGIDISQQLDLAV